MYPLDGVVVIACTGQHAGSRGVEILGELGANVIKIEEKTLGDSMRETRQRSGINVFSEATGQSLVFEGYNFNQRSVAVDAKNPDGKEIIYRLVEKADVFATNFRSTAMERLGLDYETLRSHNPRLIYVALSGYGPKGPDCDLPANDWVGQARSGMFSNQRPPDSVPWGTLGICDEMGATNLAFAVLAALYARERCGQGQKVNISLLGSMLWLQSTAVLHLLLSGRKRSPVTHNQPSQPFCNVFMAKDGKWFATLSGGIELWEIVCRVSGEDGLFDPRFESAEGREANCKELTAILDKVFSKRTRAEWLELLTKADIPCSPVNSLSEAVDDVQVLENEYVIDYDHPSLGKIKVLRLPLSFSFSSLKPMSPAPRHGEHTEEVLSEIGGYSSEEIAKLRTGGAI